MLTIYNKLEDVPEGLREHYKLIEGRYVPEISDDHPVKANNAKLVGEKGEAEAKVINAQTKITELEADLVAARSSGLPRGHEAVPKADADLARAVKAAGVATVEAFTTLKTEHGDYKQKTEEVERQKHASAVGDAMGWDRDKTALLVPSVFDLSQVELRDGDGGKKSAVAKVKQTDGSFIEKPFADVVASTAPLTALLPSLTASKEPDGTPLPGHGAGGGGGETDLIAQRNKARETARTANPNPLVPKAMAA
jgi:hypothetical protein